MKKPYYAMIIAPHPDDSEFAIAGTVARWIKQDKKVIYVICTNGNKGTDDPDMLPEKLAEIRRQEELDAAKTLGVQEVVFLDHDDQSLEDTPEFRKELVKVIRTYKPELVAAPDPYRKYVWHRDHRITGQVVLDAVFPFARDRLAYPDLLEAGFQPHKVKELLFWGAEESNYFSDVSDTFDLKMAALACHKSQVSKFTKDRIEGFKFMHAQRAKDKGYELAEAFYRVELPG
jgi:LmbE family N-acetylglucosaminyl deacetylase